MMNKTSPHTINDWHNSSHLNMSQAVNSQRQAAKQCDSSRMGHETAVNDNVGMYGQLGDTMDQKVRMSYRLREMLQHRAEAMAESCRQTKQSLAALEEALRAKEQPMRLTKWRMEQREKRPHREQVQDKVEIALENQKATLADTQRKLSEAISRTKDCIQMLDDKHVELESDIAKKTQALHIDEMCLRTTGRSHRTAVEHTPRSRALGGSLGGTTRPSSALNMGSTIMGSTRLPAAGRTISGHDINFHDGTRNEVGRQQGAVSLDQSAVKLEGMASQLRDDNRKLIMWCERAAEESAAQTERAFQERIDENKQMRRRLERELAETDAKIEHTKDTMFETKGHIQALEEPLSNVAACDAWRKQRTTKEHIYDPVTTKMQEHEGVVKQLQGELHDQHQAERENLQSLQKRRQELQDDLRDKTTALQLDSNCLESWADPWGTTPSRMMIMS